MDIGRVLRVFRAEPLFDPFRRAPEPEVERADHQFEEAVLAVEDAEAEVA